MEARVAALLLAAGTSTRMRAFKQLLPFGDRTIVETCVERILATTVSDTFVVVGHRADDVAAALAGYPVHIVRNDAYATGMSSSVKAGVAAARGVADAVMICLCDQPHVPSAVYETVLDAYRRSRALVVVPTIAGDTGHPVIFDLSLADEILAVDPAEGLRAVTYARRAETVRVPVDSVSVLDDMDTPDDYERLR